MQFPDSPSYIELTYRLKKSITPDSYDLEQWHVSADIEQEIDDDVHVGGITILSVDLDAHPFPFEALDVLAADLSKIAGATCKISRPGLNDSLQERMDLTGCTKFLILDHVVLQDEWRGSGWLGVLLAGEAIAQLSVDAGLVFTLPFPLGSADDDEPVDASDSDVKKLRAAWRQLGFRHYRDGVYFLDLSEPHFEESLTRMRKHLHG